MLLFLLMMSTSQAAIAKTPMYRAEPKKTQVYVREGVIEGGEGGAIGGYVSNIRRSKNPGYERVVLDVDGATIPAFHAALEPDQKRIVFTLNGKTKPSFSPENIKKAFTKSALVRSIDLYPKIDEESWSFTLRMKDGYPIEIFYLTSPNRIVIDIKDVVMPGSTAAHSVKKIREESLDSVERTFGGEETPE